MFSRQVILEEMDALLRERSERVKAAHAALDVTLLLSYRARGMQAQTDSQDLELEARSLLPNPWQFLDAGSLLLGNQCIAAEHSADVG